MPNPIMPSSHRLAQVIASTKNTADALSQQTYTFQAITNFGANVAANTTIDPAAPPQYRIESGGVQLRCRGQIITTGSVAQGATLFTLPYAPNEEGLFPALAFSVNSGTVLTIGLRVVALTGAVVPYAGSLATNTIIFLDPINIGILS
jgi:hypothetical protein